MLTRSSITFSISISLASPSQVCFSSLFFLRPALSPWMALLAVAVLAVAMVAVVMLAVVMVLAT